MPLLRRWFRQGGSAKGRRRRGGFSRAIRTEWRGNAVAAPLLAVRAAAQGDVILRGSGELKCRVTKGRTVQRQAARSRHTVNARLQPSPAASPAILSRLPPRPPLALALAVMASAEHKCAELRMLLPRAARTGSRTQQNGIL